MCRYRHNDVPKWYFACTEVVGYSKKHMYRNGSHMYGTEVVMYRKCPPLCTETVMYRKWRNPFAEYRMRKLLGGNLRKIKCGTFRKLPLVAFPHSATEKSAFPRIAELPLATSELVTRSYTWCGCTKWSTWSSQRALQTEVHEKAHLPVAQFRQTNRQFLNEFSDVASTASLSSWFHLLMTLSLKKWWRKSLSYRCFTNIKVWPCVRPSLLTSKNKSTGIEE